MCVFTNRSGGHLGGGFWGSHPGPDAKRILHDWGAPSPEGHIKTPFWRVVYKMCTVRGWILEGQCGMIVSFHECGMMMYSCVVTKQLCLFIMTQMFMSPAPRLSPRFPCDKDPAHLPGSMWLLVFMLTLIQSSWTLERRLGLSRPGWPVVMSGEDYLMGTEAGRRLTHAIIS